MVRSLRRGDPEAHHVAMTTISQDVVQLLQSKPGGQISPLLCLPYSLFSSSLRPSLAACRQIRAALAARGREPQRDRNTIPGKVIWHQDLT